MMTLFRRGQWGSGAVSPLDKARVIDTSLCIASLYREVLGRDASPPEIDEQLRHFRGERHLFEAMIQSEEYGRRVATFRAARGPIHLGRNELDKFNHVISLGSHCITSCLLKRWSGPLDWTFSSTGMAASCIEDRFVTFLDRKHHAFIHDPDRIVEPGGSYCDHLVYRDAFGVKSVFNHRDPRDDVNLGTYARSVVRLNRVLDDNQRALFVCITTPGRTSAQDVLWLTGALRERASRAMLLYVVVHREDITRTVPKIELVHETAHIRGFDFYPLTHMGPVAFQNPLDELFLSGLVHEFTFALDDHP